MANKSILVVGGGISGITAAVEAAEVGYEVFLIEKNAYLGGKVSQINEYFPKLCPPNCGLEINYQRIKKNPKIHVITLAEVEGIAGQEGNFDVSIKLNPRYVNEGCTGCGKCSEVCPVERANAFNFGLDKTKAIFLPQPFAYPMKYIIDNTACTGASCGKCVEACEVKAIDLNMVAKTMNINVGAIIWATGWDSYPVEKIANYGSGTVTNAVSNIMMERFASVTGPSQGKILRPSDGNEPKNIAFVQCAGSRDENHQKTCSSVCCMATLKQIDYVKRQYPDAKVTIYYMDIRAMGKHEDFYNRIKEYDINMIKGKPSEILEDAAKDVIVIAENQNTQEITQLKYDMVVLATGMAPATVAAKVPAAVAYDVDGFVQSGSVPGIYAAGCVAKPGDVASSVQSATAAVLKAIQSTVRG
ncbi:CoB--CoM heterodisulfide reductase iron-sulfur subunit A family protein [Desulfotomaculum defluvii]